MKHFRLILIITKAMTDKSESLSAMILVKIGHVGIDQGQLK